MKDAQEQVGEFMLKAGQDCPDKPTMPSQEVRKLRIKVIAEELLELCEAYCIHLEIDANIAAENRIYITEISDSAFVKPSIVDVYDAYLDLLYVVIGGANATGLPLQPGWDEVHRSNMSKFIDGHRREDGKWIKGPSYSPAQLQPIIGNQSV